VREVGDDRRILGQGILTWTKDIEVSQGHCFQAIDGVKRAAVALSGQLGRRRKEKIGSGV